MGNISVDYDVLNQKGSPAWYSDLFANIPTPGYKGRMFISTDTFAFYRDNGVGWDLVGGPGTGTITGAGVSGQLTYFIGTDVISGNNNLFYDITNGRLGINTATPGSPLDIHSTGTAAQFNGTGVNNAFVFFQNAGTSKWRIGNLYNSGANDYQIYDVLNATARLTIKNTGATTLTGTFTATSLIKSGGTSSQILLADGTTTPTSTFGAGSVTSVSAITLGTSGTDLTSSVVNSTTTPVITLNVPTASATNRGALSSADWTTFNSKQATLSLTTTGTSGAATLVGATLNIPNYTNVGTVTSVAALTLGTSGTDLSSSVANSTSTPVITLNVPTASATNRGALSSADWTTFNNKQATISVTAPITLVGALISMPVASTGANGYLSSTDWNTFNNKSNTNGTVTSVVALTIGTTGIDITSTAVTTTTTPVITLNIPTASASNRGALSSTDWTTFNNKQATLSLTTTGTSGAATLVANTLNVPNYGSALSGYVPYTGATANVTLGTNSLTGSSFTANGNNTGGYVGLTIANANTGAAQILLNNSAQSWVVNTRADNQFSIYNNTAANTPFLIDTTGAATFSSSVDATIFNSTSNVFRFSGSNALSLVTLNSQSVVKINAAGYWGTQLVGANDTGILINNTGFVGIKTTSPNAKLDLGATSGANGEMFFLYNDSTTSALSGTKVGFYLDRFSLSNNATFTFGTASSAPGSYVIASKDTSGTTLVARVIVLGETGNVGIGHTTPFTKLDIRGTTTSADATIQIVGNGVSSLLLGQNSRGGVIRGQGGNDEISLWTGGSGDTGAASSGTERIRITNGGIFNATSRGNFLGATDNALFSLNSGGTLYTVGFSPTATASSTNTFTITTGTTTWIYTGSGTATWTLPNPSGNNQIYWIKNAGTGAITLTAFSGTNIINNSAASVSTISIAVGATAVIAQDGNVKSYQLQ